MANDRILDREEDRERIARHLLATMHAMGVSHPHMMIDVANRMQRRISDMVENHDLNACSDPAYAIPAILYGLPGCALEAGPGLDLPAPWKEDRESDAPAADALTA